MSDNENIEAENNAEMELIEAVEKHNAWRSEAINLIASESILWDRTEASDYSDLSRRAVLGVPGDRYSEGADYIDKIEEICSSLAKSSFSAKFVEWRPLSGSLADRIIIHAMTEPEIR